MKIAIKNIWAILLLISVFSCERDYSFRGDSMGLKFSTDTITFDTIFTSLGSVTKNLRIYNPYSDDLTIDAIALAGGEGSKFRININGFPQSEMTDVRIRSNDSLFVFVEVTIDPGGINTPFIVNDSIVVITKERQQYIQLVAYGQDVVALDKGVLKIDTLTNEKPYLIKDYVIVDSLRQLIIKPGARIHFHNDASMLVFGGLVADGTIDEPITFEGDRLESDYKSIPGQWGFIHFFPGSKNNLLNHTIIKNGIMGVRVDSVGNGEDAPMIISNSRFEHISSIGLLAESSRISVTNSLFADCGTHSVALTVGGSYEFYHCTIARGVNWGHRSSSPAVLLNNYYEDANNNEQIVPLEKAIFGNCIIYGRNIVEIGFDLKRIEGDNLDHGAHYFFDHCLIKSGNTIDVSDPEHYNEIIANEDPSFINWKEYNYELDTLSAAKDAGKFEYGSLVPEDALGVSRVEDDGPDLGMYERIEDDQ